MLNLRPKERVKIIQPNNGGYYSHDFVKKGIDCSGRLVRILCVRNIRIVEPDIQKSILNYLRNSTDTKIEVLSISPLMSDEVINGIRKTLPNPGSSADEFRQDIITNRNHIRRLITDLGVSKNRFTYKEYKELPLIHFCQFDDELHLGVQFFDDGLGIGSLARKCFVFDEESELGKGTIDQFQTLLSNSIDIFSDTGTAITEKTTKQLEAKPMNESTSYDVFLCHNSNDKDLVRIIHEELVKLDITPWLDEKVLPPGKPWQTELEASIASINSAAVFIGENDFGPWQQHEIRAFLSEFTDRDCPVIPVILPTARNVPELPIFLKQMTWIDLRKDFLAGIQRLADSIK
ncbi:MAG: toll/interleukin-1 receptor domain-containing protein [Sedimenticola sp.]